MNAPWFLLAKGLAGFESLSQKAEQNNFKRSRSCASQLSRDFASHFTEDRFKPQVKSRVGGDTQEKGAWGRVNKKAKQKEKGRKKPNNT